MWLSQGRAIIDHLWDADEEAQQRLLLQELHYLNPFLESRARGSELLHGTIKDQLAVIMQDALELDQILMSSKAVFLIKWHYTSQSDDGAMRFDSETMNAADWEADISSSSSVRLFVSPALIKVGNADGENYDRHIVLAKASVVCD